MIDHFWGWLVLTMLCIIFWWPPSCGEYSDDLTSNRIIQAPRWLMLLACRPRQKYIDVHDLVSKVLAVSTFIVYTTLMLVVNDYDDVIGFFGLIMAGIVILSVISIFILKRFYSITRK